MSKIIFGVDVGGTNIKLAVFNEFGIVIKKWEILTDVSNNGENILKSISNEILNEIHHQKITNDDVLAIGVGVPGPVLNNSFVTLAANLGWKVKDVSQELEKLCKIKTYVGNDANLATLGEMWQGAGIGRKDIVLITLGTGVGGGIISNEKLVTGVHGAAGEIGHIKLYPDSGQKCGCGNYGCFETFASATALVRNAEKKLLYVTENTMLKNPLSAKNIFEAASNGDKLAISIVDDYCKHLAWGISIITATLDSSTVLIGGGVSKAGNFLLDKVIEYYKKYAFTPTINTEIKTAKLGNEAGIYGAAFLALSNI